MTAICYDPRRPAPIKQPHGMWRLVIRIPLPGPRDLYVGATTGRYWVPVVTRWTVALPWLNVSLPVVSARRPSVRLSRWCAHIDVRDSEPAR